MNLSSSQNAENPNTEQLIERFLDRFGNAEGYRDLARHVALPFILTPELVNLLRGEFLPTLDWVAEADLLLSELCREVGYEQFAMRLEVRALLLREAEKQLGEARLEAIARRVLGWAAGQAHEAYGFRRHELQTQQWGAMVYLKEKRAQAARELQSALAAVTKIKSQVAARTAPSAEALRLSNIILQLRDRLGDYPELIEQAESVTRLLLQSGTLRPADKNAVELVTFTFETIRLNARGKEVKRETKQARQFVEDLGNGVTLEMVEIPAGTFLMGAPESEEGSGNDERPQHQVILSPFYIGKFTVTQAQWRVVAGWEKVEIDLQPEPSHFKGDDRPVEQVSWDDAEEFCARLSKHTGRLYRLPTEAEWEYACRAGTTLPFAFGQTITPEFVNYDGNYPYGKAETGKYRGETVPVGSLGVANAFGLFDMHGNVWEWCEDFWHNSYEKAPSDGSAWLSGEDSSPRVLRGGSWGFYGSDCRSANRDRSAPGVIGHVLGFRLVSARTP